MQTKFGYILLLVFFVGITKNNLAQQSIDSVQQIDTVNIVGDTHNCENNIIHCFLKAQGTPENPFLSAQGDIGAALQSITAVQVNSYGTGNVSSISIRGANDDHTNVYWNGLKINSLTLGGTDISMVPFESGSEFIVETNNSSFGGSVSINSKTDWNNIINLRIKSDISSFDNYRNTLALKAGNNKIQFHTNTFYQTAKNNFTFADVYKFDNPIDTISHNSLKSIGTVNNLFFQLKKQIFISVGSWFQKKNKEVPSIMGSNEMSGKFQKDMLIRHYISFDKYATKTNYHLSFAHSYDELNYTDKRMPTDTFLFINSNYKTNRISNSFLVNNAFKHNLSLHSGYFYNVNIANVKEYVKKVTDHIGEVYSQLNWDNKRFKAIVKITQPFSSIKYVRPQFSAEAGYSTKENKNIIYKTSISYNDKYRFPDLNDRYWNPGGNPNLKPEFGLSINSSNSIEAHKSNHYFYSSIDIYYTKIKNNIVWTPVTNIIWSPKNLKSTQLYGIESQATYLYNKHDKIYVYLKTVYNFNRAQITEDANNADLIGNYLRYKPQHTFKANFYIEQKYIGIGLNYIYTSTRFTDEENFEYFALKPYHLLDAYLAFRGTIKEEHELQFIFKINNIANTSYESIRSYAQPLRNYTISFIYNFSKLLK